METKIELVRTLLETRAKIVRDIILKDITLSEADSSYYKGKIDGYEQALDLLNEKNIESLKIEL